MSRKYTSHPHIAHADKEAAITYKSNPLIYHKEYKDAVVIKVCKPFLNSFGFWQTNAVITHN